MNVIKNLFVATVVIFAASSAAVAGPAVEYFTDTLTEGQKVEIVIGTNADGQKVEFTMITNEQGQKVKIITGGASAGPAVEY